MRASKARNALVLTLLAAGASAVLVNLASVDLIPFARQARSSEFPAVQGTITRCQLTANNAMTGSGTIVREQDIDIEYEYVVAGRKYRNSVYAFFKKASARTERVAFAEKLKVGQSVDVFYDPDDVKMSALVNGDMALATPEGFVVLLFELVALPVVIVALVVQLIRTWRSSGRDSGATAPAGAEGKTPVL